MSVVKVKFLADTSNMRQGAKQASSAISAITKNVLPANSALGKFSSAFSPSNLSSIAKTGLAIGAVTTALSQVTDLLTNAAKAYFTDQQSIVKLDQALINNTSATDAQISSINKQIDRLSILTTIQDDDLRQSYANIVASTKSATTSMKLLRVATDVSAGSGIKLDKVSKALTKAYQGNSSALQKLLPGVKSGKAGIDELAAAYAGAGQAVGDASPFERIGLAMQNIQEVLGMSIAPLITEFANWLTTDDFQTFMDTITQSAIEMAQGFQDALDPIFQLINFISSDTFQTLLDLSKKLGPGNGPWSWFAPEPEEKKGGKDFVTTITDVVTKIREGTKSFKGFKFAAADTTAAVPEIAQRIKDAATKISDSGKKFAESLNFSEYLNKDTNVFDAQSFMTKFQSIVAAAKALPAKLRALRKAGASPEVLQQIVAMGPQEGLAVAQGFLDNAGSAKEYSGALKQLNVLGQQSMANAAGTKSYTINVTKANMTAEEIITAIQKYERKTGVKVNF